MNFNGAGTDLGYTWNNDSGSWGWSSGVQPPAGQWSLVALVVQPSSAGVYFFNTNGTQSATNFLTHPNQAFAGSGTIGTDTYSSAARVFNGLLEIGRSWGGGAPTRFFHGLIDEVTYYNRALTPAQLQQLYDNGHQLSQVWLGLNESGTNSLNLTWPQGTLFQATNLSGPWSAVTNTVSPFVTTPTNPAAFFRVLLQ